MDHGRLQTLSITSARTTPYRPGARRPRGRAPPARILHPPHPHPTHAPARGSYSQPRSRSTAPPPLRGTRVVPVPGECSAPAHVTAHRAPPSPHHTPRLVRPGPSVLFLWWVSPARCQCAPSAPLLPAPASVGAGILRRHMPKSHPLCAPSSRLAGRVVPATAPGPVRHLTASRPHRQTRGRAGRSERLAGARARPES